MNAQEMFEKLGYFTSVKTSLYLEISSKNNNCINFWLDIKSYDCDESIIDVELHKAITQQMKELKWL